MTTKTTAGPRSPLPSRSAIGLAVPASASALNVYAAASLREVFEQIDSAPTYNFAGSNVLQTQIENGAPADVFASASPQEAQALFKAGNCERPVTFATNKLVHDRPEGQPRRTCARSTRLRKGGLRVAIGTPGVPIGAYTRSVLKRLGLTKALQHEHRQPGVQRRGHRLQGRARLGRRRLRLRDRRQDRQRSRQRDQAAEVRPAAGALPDLRGQAQRRRRRAARGRSSTRFAPSRGRSLLKKAGFGLPPKG